MYSKIAQGKPPIINHRGTVEITRTPKNTWFNPNLRVPSVESSKERREMNRGDTLVIGDSMIKYAQPQGCTVMAFPGIHAAQLRARVENMPPEKKIGVTTVILHVGTNDLHRTSSADDVMGEVVNLIKATKQTFPNVNIVVNNIVNRRDKSRRLVNKTNYNIRWACKDLNVVCNDINKYLDDTCLARDGLHLNRKGVYILDRVLSNVSKICCDQGNL